jgi:metal-sulfur cluster biosynthetic enzyme
MTKQDILNELEKVEHPAINYSLIKLGILTDVELINNTVSVVFAFPFPNIPVGDMLINSIAQPVISLGLGLDYKIRIMNEEEKARFLELEIEAWKG